MGRRPALPGPPPHFFPYATRGSGRPAGPRSKIPGTSPMLIARGDGVRAILTKYPAGRPVSLPADPRSKVPESGSCTLDGGRLGPPLPRRTETRKYRRCLAKHFCTAMLFLPTFVLVRPLKLYNNINYIMIYDTQHTRYIYYISDFCRPASRPSGGSTAPSPCIPHPYVG